MYWINDYPASAEAALAAWGLWVVPADLYEQQNRAASQCEYRRGCETLEEHDASQPKEEATVTE